MNYFISYDISDNKKRNRIAKYLLKAGFDRVQKSVFFIINLKPKTYLSLRKALRKIMEDEPVEAEDSILFIQTDQDQLPSTDLLTSNTAFQERLKEKKFKLF